MSKRITAITWHSYTTTLRQARDLLQDRQVVRVYSARSLDEGRESLADALEDMAQSDLIYLYRSTGENIWHELDAAIPKLNRPVVCDAHDPSLWTLSTVTPG